MDSMDEIRETFFIECEDLLNELENGLLMLNEGYGDKETINGVFRAVHSIKGGAGAFGLDDLVSFAHTFETTFDEVRSDRIELTSELLKLFLQCSDMLADLVTAAQDNSECDLARVDELLTELKALTGGETEDGADTAIGDNDFSADSSAELDENGVAFQPLSFDLGDFGDLDNNTDENVFNITFTPKLELYSSGNESALLLRALKDLGEVEISCDTSQVPALDELSSEGAYLSWNIKLTTVHTQIEVSDVFEFVEGLCDLDITTENNNFDTEDLPIPPDLEPLELNNEGSALNEEEAIPSDTAAECIDKTPSSEAPQSEADEQKKLKEEKKPVIKKTTPAKDSTPPVNATIRVNLERVDRMINLVGELVINQAMLAQGLVESGMDRNSAVASGVDEFKQLTRQIQESVMAIRAQPVKSLFQRMSRIVREAANATDKTVRLITEGETTEVDKTVIEKLADPLTHMIRNAVDHGLETPEKRLKAGKNEEGIVRLSAVHRSGKIIIEINDDGGGINRERVKQIAIDKKLIPEDAILTDSEIDNLLFMPGFSTAKEVSNLSGRGVGMDVVKRSIQELGGRISISSQPGKGSTFTISLPLTLAVLDGMVVRVADQTLVIPLTAVFETLKITNSDTHSIGADAKVLSNRGEFIPIIDIGEEMGYRDTPANIHESVVLSVETGDGARSALLLDSIVDQRQVVIKSLEDNYGQVPGVAAATILGDGRIALILDVDALVSRAGVGANTYLDNQLAATG